MRTALRIMSKFCESIRRVLSPRGGAWIGQLLAFMVLFFLIVPAYQSGWSYRSSSWNLNLSPVEPQVLRHGWPWWFVEREEIQPLWFVPTPIQAWRLGTDVLRFRTVALCGDIAVAVLCLSAVGPLWRVSRGPRRALIRFRMKTLLAYISVIAVIAAVAASRYHRIRDATEAKALLSPASHRDCECFLPFWVTELTGTEMWERVGLVTFHCGSIYMPQDPTQFEALKRLTDIYPQDLWLIIELKQPMDLMNRLPELSAIENVQVSSAPDSDTSLAFLGNLPNLLRLATTVSADEDFVHIGALHNLRELSIEQAYGKEFKATDDDFKCMAQLKNLQSLNIEQCGTSSSGIAQLRGMERLKHLSFHSAPVDDAAFHAFVTLKKLEVLTLSETSVTGIIIEQLAHCRNLQNLSISGAPVTDAAAPGIGKITSLRSVDLSETWVSDATLHELRTLPRLDELNVSRTRIHSLMPLRRGFPTLRKISFSNVDAAEIAALASERPELELREVLPDSNLLHKGASFQMQSGFGYVEAGRLAQSPADLPVPVPTEDVRRVWLCVFDLDLWVEWLSVLPNLREVNLNGGRCTDAQLARLVDSCLGIEDLNISQTRVSDHGVTCLERLPKLWRLTLDSSQVDQCEELVQRLPELKELYVRWISPESPRKEWNAVHQRLLDKFPKLRVSVQGG